MTQAAVQNSPTGLTPITPDDPRAYTVSPMALPHATQLAMIEQTLRAAAASGWHRVGVFPAGRHSHRLTPDLFSRCGVTLSAFLDDTRRGSLHDVPVLRPEGRGLLDAVLISSDSAERAFAAQAATWASGTPILRPYQTLENPGFADFQRRRAQELARLRLESPTRLNLGCGHNPLAGWTNIDGGDGLWYEAPSHPDVIALDVFEALAAIPDGSCDFVYSEHFYEHFSLADGFQMACEWARVLKPGGVVRVVTPDLTREARMYLGEQLPTDAATYMTHKRRWLGERRAQESRRFLTPAMLLNFGMRLDGHQFVYDFETLRAQLQAAGFEAVTRERFGASSRPELHGIDRHRGGDTGGVWAEEIQLVVEAVRER
ncbi:MAG: methyltransferase domain-containing protein [Phycisphaerales bacterium]|nr:methyltransferase domain-containing protein [Phycisphaerales bacterium]